MNCYSTIITRVSENAKTKKLGFQTLILYVFMGFMWSVRKVVLSIHFWKFIFANGIETKITHNK